MRKKMFWIGLIALMLEIGLLIGMMKLAAPLKEVLPAYGAIVVAMAVLSILFIKWGKSATSDTKTLVFGLTAGMLWWTISEINVDVFNGSGIEDQAGFLLIVIALLALATCWKDINKTSKIAISTFMFNWGAHMVLKLLMHFRNPTAAIDGVDPSVWSEPMNIFNIIGFAYGVLSVAAIIYLTIRAIRKGFSEGKIHYFTLTMYVAIVNLLYIFVHEYFILW